MNHQEDRVFNLFVGFAAQDNALRESLLQHLTIRLGEIRYWSVDMAPPGTERRQALSQALDQADVALILLSADYLEPSFTCQVEVPELKRQHQERGLSVVLVLLRPCLWQPVSWPAALGPLPRTDRAIDTYQGAKRDQILAGVAQEIAELASNRQHAGDTGTSPSEVSKERMAHANESSPSTPSPTAGSTGISTPQDRAVRQRRGRAALWICGLALLAAIATVLLPRRSHRVQETAPEDARNDCEYEVNGVLYGAVLLPHETDQLFQLRRRADDGSWVPVDEEHVSQQVISTFGPPRVHNVSTPSGAQTTACGWLQLSCKGNFACMASFYNAKYGALLVSHDPGWSGSVICGGERDFLDPERPGCAVSPGAGPFLKEWAAAKISGDPASPFVQVLEEWRELNRDVFTYATIAGPADLKALGIGVQDTPYSGAVPSLGALDNSILRRSARIHVISGRSYFFLHRDGVSVLLEMPCEPRAPGVKEVWPFVQGLHARCALSADAGAAECACLNNSMVVYAFRTGSDVISLSESDGDRIVFTEQESGISIFTPPRALERYPARPPTGQVTQLELFEDGRIRHCGYAERYPCQSGPHMREPGTGDDCRDLEMEQALQPDHGPKSRYAVAGDIVWRLFPEHCTLFSANDPQGLLSSGTSAQDTNIALNARVFFPRDGGLRCPTEVRIRDDDGSVFLTLADGAVLTPEEACSTRYRCARIAAGYRRAIDRSEAYLHSDLLDSPVLIRWHGGQMEVRAFASSSEMLHNAFAKRHLQTPALFDAVSTLLSGVPVADRTVIDETDEDFAIDAVADLLHARFGSSSAPHVSLADHRVIKLRDLLDSLLRLRHSVLNPELWELPVSSTGPPAVGSPSDNAVTFDWVTVPPLPGENMIDVIEYPGAWCD